MMNLALVTDVLGDLEYTEMLDTVKNEYNINALEMTAGGWSPCPHINTEELLNDKNKLEKFKNELDSREMKLVALNCSGNPLSPGELGKEHTKSSYQTVELAEKLGVKKIVMMSGLPGGGPNDKVPNWITSTVSWPDYMPEALEYQWNEVAIPWWKEFVQHAKKHGIEKIALEAFPSQLVYSVSTLLKLRNEVSEMIGMNLDPSHLFILGADPIAAIRPLKGAIHHVHGKDARIERGLADIDGLPETKVVEDTENRTWNYVAVGSGHDLQWWKEFFSVLSMVGYEGYVSLEMEDLTMSIDRGLKTSIDALEASLSK